MKRAFILCCLCTLSLISCGSQNQSIETTTVVDTTIGETEPVIPVKDFGGETITIYARDDLKGNEWNVSDIDAEVETGEPINDAVYRRNSNIMDRYNVKLEIVRSGAMFSVDTVRNVVLSGDDIYDALMLAGYDMTALTQEKMLYNLLSLENINSYASYWNPTLSESLTLENKLYAAIGDISTIDNRAVRCLYFNKDLFDSYNLEYPYQSVLDGNWTYEDFFSLVAMGNADLDGNSVYDENDQYGLFVQSSLGMNLYYASGLSYINKSDEGLLVPEFTGEKAVEIMQDISDLIASNKSSIAWSDDFQKYMTLFSENKGLFYAEVLYFTEYFRQYDFNFGILPMPKYDENQENYQQFADGSCVNLCGIPITNNSPEDAALILEALSAESVELLTPAYYDVCLIGKQIRDDESRDMLDIIFNSYVVDYGNLLQLSVCYTLNNAMINGSNVASIVESQRSQTESLLNDYNELMTE